MAEYAVAGAAPPEPDFVLRGHLAPITTCRFVETDRERLLASADTSGVAKLWSLRARRPVVSWAASDTIEPAAVARRSRSQARVLGG